MSRKIRFRMASMNFGGLTVEAAVCESCPGGAMIYPPSALEDHLQHHANIDRHLRAGTNPDGQARRNGGNHGGSHHGHRMSSTGVTFKQGIRAR